MSTTESPTTYSWSKVPSYWQERGLSVRAANALANAGINNLDDLKRMTAMELLRLPNFGRVSLREVQKRTGWPKGPPTGYTFRQAVERFVRETLRRFDEPNDDDRVRETTDQLIEWFRTKGWTDVRDD